MILKNPENEIIVCDSVLSTGDLPTKGPKAGPNIGPREQSADHGARSLGGNMSAMVACPNDGAAEPQTPEINLRAIKASILKHGVKVVPESEKHGHTMAKNRIPLAIDRTLRWLCDRRTCAHTAPKEGRKEMVQIQNRA